MIAIMNSLGNVLEAIIKCCPLMLHSLCRSMCSLWARLTNMLPQYKLGFGVKKKWSVFTKKIIDKVVCLSERSFLQ